MSHRFVIVVNVTVDRDSGPFASRDELESQIVEAIEAADPSSLSGDNGGEYVISSWDVTVEDADPRPKARK